MRSASSVQRLPGAQRGFMLLGLVGLLTLLGLLAAWGQAALPLSTLQDGNRLAVALQARSAAESGLALAMQLLNDPRGAGPQCEALAGEPQASWWERRPGGAPSPLAVGGGAGAGLAGNGVQAAELRCTRAAGGPGPASAPGWRCTCGAQGGAAVTPPAASSGPVQVSFSVRWAAPSPPTGDTERADLDAAGCVRVDGDCRRPARGAEAPAARQRVGLRVWPAVPRLPQAAWTAGRSIQLSASVELLNSDAASGGRVLHAGGGVDAGGAVLQGLPGAPQADLVLRGDRALAGWATQLGVARWLGSAPAAWARAPRVTQLDCSGAASACRGGLQRALDDGAQALRVVGDLQLQPGFRVGSEARPVVLVVDGALQLQGPGELHGLAMASSIQADGDAGPIQWRGAALALGASRARGRVRVEWTPEVRESIEQVVAGVLAAPGSWRQTAGGEALP